MRPTFHTPGRQILGLGRRATLGEIGRRRAEQPPAAGDLARDKPRVGQFRQVGIIGASAKAGWARESHVPAVQGLDGLELGAVVVKTQEQADAAAKAFGARAGYADPQTLFDDRRSTSSPSP